MNSQTYQTTDTPEAAYLVSCGFNYKEMSFVDDEKIAFIFDATKELLEEAKKYKTGKALVEPTKFLYNFKKLLSDVQSLKKKHRWQKPKIYHSYKRKW
jgi:hypothetical protein